MINADKRIEQLAIFKTVAQTYQEVAALRMRRMKDYVLRNREFLHGISSIFTRVKLSYNDTIKKILESKGITDEDDQLSYINKMNFTKKNGKTVLVFASANTGLYGDIILKVFNYFAKHIDSTVDLAVLGKLGKLWFPQRFPNRKFLYYDLSDGDPDPKEVSKIMEDLSVYENIIMFHGKFKDILEQVPLQSGISGDAVTMETLQDMRQIRCIFEPTLEEVFEFFETEIKASLFEHALYESALSKYTSRMVSLDMATNNALHSLKKLRLERSLMKHHKDDKEKNTVLAGVLYGC